jgi:hypothetical protein
MSSPDSSSKTSTTARVPAEDMVVNYFIVSNDIERSRRFYVDILGGKVVFSGVPTVVELANSRGLPERPTPARACPTSV